LMMWARQPKPVRLVTRGGGLLGEACLGRQHLLGSTLHTKQQTSRTVVKAPLRFARARRYKQQRQHDVGLHGRRQAPGRAGAGRARAHELRRELQRPLQWRGRSPRAAVRLARGQHAAGVPRGARAAQLCPPRAGGAEARAAGGRRGSAGGDRCRPAVALSSKLFLCMACL